MKIKIAANSTLAFILATVSAYSFWLTLDAFVGLRLGLPAYRPILSTLTWGLFAIVPVALAVWLAPSLTMGHIVAQERYWCGDAKPLPLEYPRSAPFKLDKLLFISADEHSYGQVELSATPIDDFTFIVELVDTSGRHVVSVPISSHGRKDGSEFDAAIPFWYPASGLKAGIGIAHPVR
jgi:hypothetical protein